MEKSQRIGTWAAHPFRFGHVNEYPLTFMTLTRVSQSRRKWLCFNPNLMPELEDHRAPRLALNDAIPSPPKLTSNIGICPVSREAHILSCSRIF